MQKHFLVHLACALKDVWNKKKYKDVGSSTERFLRLGCKHPRRPRGSQSGREKRRNESFHYGRKRPWVPTLTEPFPKIQADAGSWLGTKNALYYCAQSTNKSQWVHFVRSYMMAIVSIVACLTYAPKKCTQSGNFQFDIKSPSDPTRLLCQMQANSSGAEFLSTISKFMKRMNFVIACLRPSQNVKLGIFTGSRAVDGKEMYKKAWCTSKIVVLSCQAIWISHRRRILIVIRQKQNILGAKVNCSLLIVTQTFFQLLGCSFVSG